MRATCLPCCCYLCCFSSLPPPPKASVVSLKLISASSGQFRAYWERNERALELGHAYAALTREQKGTTMWPTAAEPSSASSTPVASVVERLSHLDGLKADGLMRDEDIRKTIETLAKTGKVSDDIQTITIPEAEKQRVIQALLARLDASGIEQRGF